MTQSIWVCTLKKSASVLEKWVLYTAYVIDALAAMVVGSVIAVYGSAAIWGCIEKYVVAFAEFVGGVAGLIASMLFGIPWWVYAGGGAVLAIPVYSLLWCVNREITEEDWEFAKPLLKFGEQSIPAVMAFIAVAYQIVVGFILNPEGADSTYVLLHGLIVPIVIFIGGIIVTMPIRRWIIVAYYTFKRTRGSQ